MKSLTIAFIFVLLFLHGCSNSERFYVDVAQIDTEMSFIRFDTELGKNDTLNAKQNIQALSETYPLFFRLFTNQIIQIGSPENLRFLKQFNRFVSDSVYCQVFDSVQAYSFNYSGLNQTMEEGFKRYIYFFPQKEIPDVYYHISGFNESVVVARNILGISVDNYLGSQHTFYKWLALYEYLRVNMYPEKIPSDALWAWLTTEFNFANESQNLLSKMVHDGRILFTLQKLLPNEPLYRIHSYTPEQFNWCEANEKSAWTYIIEYKHLFSKDLATIKKYTSAGPFTHYFGTESAPRMGGFIGYKIVEQFMENNAEVTLQELMQINDMQIILEKSGYQP